jgi:DNA-binding TFAR19-related protein (PDSD5 family)
MDENLDSIKQKKILELQKQYQERAELEKQVSELETFVKARLTKEAIARYSNIKVAHPELALQLLIGLSQIMQQNKIIINDEQLKELLSKALPKKRETKISMR